MILTKVEILNWLEKNDRNYQENMEKNAYELINIHEVMNQSLLNELIKKDNLPSDYFEKLKQEGHQFIINCQSDVNMYVKDMAYIPIQFYHIDGDFKCSINQLQSLKGCPVFVVRDFACDNNQLTSMEYCPQMVGGNFSCHHNQLISLKYCPQIINGDFDCSYNKLESLQNGPKRIEGYFYCIDNHLKNLNFFPTYLKYHADLSNNKITSLSYFLDSFDLDISICLKDNNGLIKYKNLVDGCVKWSDKKFMNQKSISFWHKIHLIAQVIGIKYI